MFISLEKLKECESWDFVIVGAGTIALLIASRLELAGKRVLCLESGSLSFDTTVHELNSSLILGEKHLGVHDGRARVVGGTSTLWGGQLARFSYSDFARKREDGTRYWPIELDDVLPWYRSVAKELNLTGYSEDDKEILRNLCGQNLFQQIQENLNFSDIGFYFTHWLRVPNLYTIYRERIQASTAWNVATHANVESICIGDRPEKVISVKARDKAGRIHEIFGDRIILANGTIEISRLLLNSSKQDSSTPWTSNKFVGRYFQDHIDIDCGTITATNDIAFAKVFENGILQGTKVQPRLFLKRTDLISTSIAGSIKFESNVTEEIDNLKRMIKSYLVPGQARPTPLDFIKNFLGAHRIWGSLAWNYLRHRRIKAFWDKGIILRAHMEQRPDYNSYISLSDKEFDITGQPKAVLNWTVNWKEQHNNLQHFCKSVATLLHIGGLATLHTSQSIINGNLEELSIQSRDSFHQCGGAIIGTSEMNGVVDSNLKVFGTENLYVAGAATFPTSSYANPTFTAMALALRSIDKILNDEQTL